MQLREAGNPIQIPEREELEQCLALRIDRHVPTRPQPLAAARAQ